MSSSIPPHVRRAVLIRDGYRCIAPAIDGRADWCRNIFGTVITSWLDRDPGPTYLQMSHVKDQGELAMSKKATPDEQHLVSLCPHHHTGTVGGSNWEAVNRNRIRKHLDDIYRPSRSLRR